jgi:hypothetical protein
VEGDLRLQGQAWDWFDPGRGEPDYAFLGARLRARLKYSSPGLSGLLEVQDVQMSGLPRGAVLPAPAGQMGVGGVYFNHIQASSANSTGVRQIYLKIGDPKDLSVQLGRFDYASGQEVLSGDPTLDWLLRVRVGQRLLGSFGYTEFGRSFDGIRLDADWEPAHLTALAARPTQGGFEPRFAVEMDRVFVSNLALTLKKGEGLPDATGQIFWNRYDDTRQVPFVDNRPAPLRGQVAAQGGIHIDTCGLQFASKLGQDGDALLWYAHQTGRWGRLTHRADAATLELGYRFSGADWQPWVRAGYTWFSGDGNPNDGLHTTFYAPLPTARLYARFPFYTLANLRDAFGQLLLSPSRDTRIRLDLDLLSLDRSADLWYVGGGATQNQGSIFGYAGRPGGGGRRLATLVGLGLDHTFDEHNSLSVYYGYAWGGEVVRQSFPADTRGSLFLVEYNLSLP